MSLYRIGTIGAAAMLALASHPAFAHITFEKSEASPKTFYKGVLRVPHGCDGAATTALEVKMPEGMIGAKPVPKPGWTLDIAKGPYAKAYAFIHGTLDKGATSFTWKGGELPDDQFDEFVFQAYVSDAFAPGSTVAFPVTQTCTGGKSASWTEVPKAGQDAHALKAPAPTLRIIAPDASGAAMHHHH